MLSRVVWRRLPSVAGGRRNKRYIVDLTAEERAGLLALLNRGIAPARRLTRARVLPLADEGGAGRWRFTVDQARTKLHRLYPA